MSQDTDIERPKNAPQDQRRDKKPRTDWTAFDLEMINCAKHGFVVDLFFLTDIPINREQDGVSGMTGNVLIVDKYFLKMSIPTSEGTQREVWIPKSVIGLAEAHKIKPTVPAS